MKKFLVIALVLSSATLMAAMNNVVITFRSAGPDRYGDGSVVKDGECYALVWTKTGKTFSGFTADGKSVDADSKVLLAVPRAKGGKCETTAFQINPTFAASLADGSYAVYLIDTRDVNGVVLGVDAKLCPKAVNAYGVVESASGEMKVGSTTSALAMVASQSGVATTAAKLSAVPPSAPQPLISDIKVENGKVVLSVANTVSCLQYNVAEGASPNGIGADNVAKPAQGDDSKTIQIEVPLKDGDTDPHFFRVKRN